MVNWGSEKIHLVAFHMNFSILFSNYPAPATGYDHFTASSLFQLATINAFVIDYQYSCWNLYHCGHYCCSYSWLLLQQYYKYTMCIWYGKTKTWDHHQPRVWGNHQVARSFLAKLLSSGERCFCSRMGTPMDRQGVFAMDSSGVHWCNIARQTQRDIL